MAFVAHHLIQFTREALRGEQNASFYSARQRLAAETAHAPTRSFGRDKQDALKKSA
jgi:hypothetical protein